MANPKPRQGKSSPRELVKIARVNAELEGWITRTQAADLMGISTVSLMNWERIGRITARTAWRHDSQGKLRKQIVYDPKQIICMPRRSLRPVSKDPDELAARVTEHIEQGWTDREIVLELRVDYIKVDRLRKLWEEAGGRERMLTRDHADAFVELVGPFDTMDDLLARVRELVLAASERKTEVTEP